MLSTPDIEEAMLSIRHKMQEEVKSNLRERGGKKWQVNALVSFVKLQFGEGDNTEEVKTDRVWFREDFVDIANMSQFSTHYRYFVNKLHQRVVDFVRNGSGLVFRNI